MKKKVDTVARHVSKCKSDTTADHDQADHQIGKWAKIWRAEQIHNEMNPPKATYRLVVAARIQWKERVADTRIKDYRCIIGTFKSTTAVTYDNVAPRALALSDSIIIETILLFDRCEHETMTR